MRSEAKLLSEKAKSLWRIHFVARLLASGNRTDMPIVLSVTTMEKVSLKQESVALFRFEWDLIYQ